MEKERVIVRIYVGNFWGFKLDKWKRIRSDIFKRYLWSRINII